MGGFRRQKKWHSATLSFSRSVNLRSYLFNLPPLTDRIIMVIVSNSHKSRKRHSYSACVNVYYQTMAERGSLGKILIRRDASTFERENGIISYATFEFRTQVGNRRGNTRHYCTTYQKVSSVTPLYSPQSWQLLEVTKWKEPGIKREDTPRFGWNVSREDAEQDLRQYGCTLDDLFEFVLKAEQRKKLIS